MRSSTWISIVSGMALAGCGSPRQAAQPSIVVTPRAAGDRVDVTVSKDGVVVLDVHSPRGIGSATLAIEGAPLPTLRFRMHLKGLEELRLEYDSTAVRVAVPSSPPHDARCSASDRGGAEVPVEPGSTRFMTVRLVPVGAAAPTIPLQDGVIEVDAPAELSQRGVRAATLRWVDFFR